MGHRRAILSRSCPKLAGGKTMRPVSRRGVLRAWSGRTAGGSLALKLPCTWHARIRTSSITGVLDASGSANPCSTIQTMDDKFGRGSSGHKLELHREGMAALLHNRGALAVILPPE